MSFESSLTDALSFLSHNYKPILASIAAVWSYKQISNIAQEHHTLHYELSHEQRTAPLDSDLFPQYFKNAGGLHLYVRRWLVPNPKAMIFLVHGYCEHISRYEHVALYLNSRGFSVVGCDHQGHGGSDGDSLHVASFNHFVEDYIAFAEREQAWFTAKCGPYGPNPYPAEHHGHRPRSSSSASSYLPAPAPASPSPVPMVLLGHSMGGLIASLVAQHSHAHPSLAPWKALVLSSPCMDVDPELKSPIMMFFSTYLSKYLPKLVVTKLASGDVSSLAAVRERYERDVIMSGRRFVRARLGYELLQATKRVQKRASELKLPILAMHSPSDKIVTVSGTKAFFDAAGSTDKTFIELGVMGHESLNDWDRERLLKLIGDWLEERVEKN